LQSLCRKAAIASRHDPFNPYGYEYLAKAARNFGQFKLAAIAYERALKRSPHRAAWWFHLARCYQMLGDQEKAKMAMVQARRWYPANRQYRF
jgi:cytochrome c-type biogenesis protein CcmH/NrfG